VTVHSRRCTLSSLIEPVPNAGAATHAAIMIRELASSSD
jgi:hypothetical protein